MTNEVRPLKVVAAALMLACGITILTVAMNGNEAKDRDFIAYWAAGQQLVHHQNPYDGIGIHRLQHAAGYKWDRPFFIRNAPTALFLTAPLGLVSARLGAILWALALVAALVGSIRMIWIMAGRQPDRLHLLGYIFPPALACLVQGQIGIFLLLGVTTFLYCYESMPLLAGAALLTCALKPHLFMPFGCAVLLWIIVRKKYRILTGAGIALAASLAIAFLLDPSAWSQYRAMIAAENITEEFIPTFSLALRLAVHTSWWWLQVVPAIVATFWGVHYFWKNRERWNWKRHGCLLLVLSVMVAPYAWFTDEAVVLPAILFGLYRASDRLLTLFSCIAGVALLEVFAGVRINSGFYLWTTVAWTLWYIAILHGKSVYAPTAQQKDEGIAVS